MSPLRAPAALAGPFDPAREQAALQIQRTRRIHLRWEPDGWRSFTGTDSETVIDPTPYADPVEALEAAEAALATAEVLAAKRTADALLGHLQAGRFYPRPGLDPQGGIVWQIRRAADSVVVDTRPGLVGALIRIGELNTPPPAAPGPGDT